MMITAHSGCDDTPMNSVEYLKHVIILKPDALEIDVRERLDGVLVLSHDSELKNPLTLAQAFELLKDNSVQINCDLKEPGLEFKVLNEAEKAGIENERLIFTGTVRPYRKNEWPDRFAGVSVFLNFEELVPGMRDKLCAISENFNSMDEAFNYVLSPEEKTALFHRITDMCRYFGCSVLNVEHSVCTEEFANICRKKNVDISVWTVSEEKDIQRILGLNAVENITTRDPGLVKRIMEDRRNFYV